MNAARARLSLGIFTVLAVVSLWGLLGLTFSFDFNQFFPQGDPDLAFFESFKKDFEADDNFLMIAVVREEGVMDSAFLADFHAFTIDCQGLPHVLNVQSLTKFSYPIKTPFGFAGIPVIHLKDPSKYAADKARMLADPRFRYNLVDAEAKSLAIFIKTIDDITLPDSEALLAGVDALEKQYSFEAVHKLGRPYFQRAFVDMQKREVIFSTLIASVLVTFIIILLYRKVYGLFLALSSIGLGMLLFFGFLGWSGRELNALSALYPVLMIIVGTSDVVHMMSKYIDEWRKSNLTGEARRQAAVMVTIREIGLATLLTSATTAIGFLSLTTSKVAPIHDFGINAAIGVMIAYLTVVLFTTSLMYFIDGDKLVKAGLQAGRWDNWLTKIYGQTKEYPKQIALATLLFLVVAAWGIQRIQTNFSIVENMPRGSQLTEDFQFFEKYYSGFRPLEFAVIAKQDHRADEYAILKEVDKLEQRLASTGTVRTTTSFNTVIKSVNAMMHGNQLAYYQFPEDSMTFQRYLRLAQRTPALSSQVLLSKDGKKTRVASRVLDIGADSVLALGARLEDWANSNLDTTKASFIRTGTGLILDKNSEYIRDSLLQGLGMAVLVVSFLIALLFRNWKMLLIALVPNMIPMVAAGALLGYAGIDLEASVSIVFAIIFGIAVDDTIHFLSRFKIERLKQKSIDESLHTTFLETGKPIIITSIILFFGYLVMLFSVHPPSVTIGILISLTLVTAVIADLYLIPVMIRWLMKE